MHNYHLYVFLYKLLFRYNYHKCIALTMKNRNHTFDIRTNVYCYIFTMCSVRGTEDLAYFSDRGYKFLYLSGFF